MQLYIEICPTPTSRMRMNVYLANKWRMLKRTPFYRIQLIEISLGGLSYLGISFIFAGTNVIIIKLVLLCLVIYHKGILEVTQLPRVFVLL